MIGVRTVTGNPAYYFGLLVTLYNSDKYLETLLTLFKISFRPQNMERIVETEDNRNNVFDISAIYQLCHTLK